MTQREFAPKPLLTRRGFLALGAAAACAPRAWAGARLQPAPLRAAIIGCGQRGLAQARRLQAFGPAHGVELAAACDVFAPHRDRAAAAGIPEVCGDPHALVERGDIAAVVIATPDHLHAPLAAAALRAGKHVYCERPLAHGAADLDMLRGAAVRPGALLETGADPVAMAGWRLARRLVAEGRIGAVRWVQVVSRCNTRGTARAAGGADNSTPDAESWTAFLGTAPSRALDPNRFFGWRDYADYSAGVFGGPFFDMLAPVVAVLGAPAPQVVSAAGGVAHEGARETPDTMLGTVEFAGGCTVMLSASAADPPGASAVIRGSLGSMEVWPDAVRVTPERAGASAETIRAEAHAPSLLEGWLAAIRGGAPCICGLETALATQQALNMARKAWQTGRTVTV